MLCYDDLRLEIIAVKNKNIHLKNSAIIKQIV